MSCKPLAAGLAAIAIPLASIAQDPEEVGQFSEPFVEPSLVVDGEQVTTDRECMTNDEGMRQCKPAAGTLTARPDGRFMYFNALEGTENIELSIVAEFGEVSIDDQSRVLTIGPDDEPSWNRPTPLRADVTEGGNDSTTLTDGALDTSDSTQDNDSALFCTDVVALADGDILAVGGTDYYLEPGADGVPFGVSELEGLKRARIFDTESNTWKKSGDMAFGRWYPSLVTQANGNIFVASGVTKLVKPVYPDNPINSGRNVVQTETFNPCEGEWAQNPSTADRSLPLYPRLHLLPNGHILYNAGGQVFNPFGQGYDQALWNIVSAYDPEAQRWTDLGYAGLPLQLNDAGLDALSTTVNATNLNQEQLDRLVGEVTADPASLIDEVVSAPTRLDENTVEQAIGAGMRGSTFSIMLPLEPDEKGEYHEAEFLTAGGVPTYVTAGSPGGYFPTDMSRVDTVTVDGKDIDYQSRLTGKLNQPRWYSTAVVLPDQSVMVFSGGTRDAVVGPGIEGAIKQAERFDPETETWERMAVANRPRTYHNTAALMPDGRVLVGGHAPISTAYLSNINLEELGFAPNDGRDPSFEIYTPPYALRDDRPAIREAPDTVSPGDTFTVRATPPETVDEVLLIRRTTLTHLVDGDQRAVVLPIVDRNGAELTVRMPDNRAVVPAGPYMLFVSKPSQTGRVPSESIAVSVTHELTCTAPPVPTEDAPSDDGSEDDNLLDGVVQSIGL